MMASLKKEQLDVLIIGGGPCGLAAAVEVKKKGLTHLIIEKGSVTESIRKYPKRMTFFSTAENLEIGGIPFAIAGPKPTRDEALKYYRKVAQFYELNLKLFTTVEKITKTKNGFTVNTTSGDHFHSRYLIIATGYFDIPRQLNIPGESLPHVSHYYDEPYQHAFTNVAVVGGGNSAIETALDLYRHNADMTIVIRKPDFKKTVKYWLVPDIQNRIKEGKLKAIFNSEVVRIGKKEMEIRNVKNGKKSKLKADFVYLLTGYLPDIQLLAKSGVKVDKETFKTNFNRQTYETQVDGMYLCGTVLAGIQTESVFIENGREHAKKIAEDIYRKKES